MLHVHITSHITKKAVLSSIKSDKEKLPILTSNCRTNTGDDKNIYKYIQQNSCFARTTENLNNKSQNVFCTHRNRIERYDMSVGFVVGF